MKSQSEFISDLIEEFTKDNKVDIIGIANKLQIKIYQKEMTSSSDLGMAKFPMTAERPTIYLNKANEQKQNFTLVALLLASCLISPDAVQQIGVTYDVFSLRDAIKNRYSSTMFMATRLAIPEAIIDQLTQPGFDIENYAKTTQYMSEFICGVVKESSINVVMDAKA